MLLYGGPKLGKTSLLLHLRWLLEQERASSGNAPAAQYLDLHEKNDCERFLAGEWGKSAVLLLDNCDFLLRSPLSQLPSQATVWAGGRTWRDFVSGGGLHRALLPVPLAILLIGEARALIKPNLTPDQVATVLSYGGTHPYVLKVLHARMIADGPTGDPTQTIQAVQARLAPFFLACFQELRTPIERALLDYLIKQDKPINPRDAAKALGYSTIKAAADVLCYVGLISRWNLNEGAMLQANCRLFNGWYLAYSECHNISTQGEPHG